MKAKQISALMAGVLFASAEMPAQDGDSADPSLGQPNYYERLMEHARTREVPSLERVEYITLTTRPTIWEGRFFRNGSAILSYGRANRLNPQATAPKGSFSFEDVYRLLAPRLERYEYSGQDMYVCLHLARGELDLAWGFLSTEENKEIARKLMRELSKKALPLHKGFSSKKEIEGLLATYPLVSGDEPTPAKRSWLCIGILSALCAGAVLWLIRRKK